MENLKSFEHLIETGEMTVSEIEESARVYLGHGTYSYVGVIITAQGLSNGWKYQYPCLRFNDIMYEDAGKTREGGIIDGDLALSRKTITAV